MNLGQLVKCGGMVIITVTFGLLHLFGPLRLIHSGQVVGDLQTSL